MKIKSRDAGSVRILDLNGKVNHGVGDLALREAVRQLLDEGQVRIVLNLKQVEWIDTSGVGELVACKKRAVGKGGDVKLLMPNGTVYKILSMVGLHLAFDIYDDEVKAVGSTWSQPHLSG